MHQTSSVIVCGLAGALTTDLASGTVLIPDKVSLVNGKEMRCDPLLVQILISAARTLHMPLKTGPLLTTPSLTVGKARLYWAQQGFVAVDMETGLLLEQNPRVATIRVILDSPKHDLSSSWLWPGNALRQPQIWKQLFWLSWIAPRYAFQAARVVKTGIGSDPASVSLDFTKEKK
jgi:nucleoside phosphorylase